jgi:hypothetical protein
MTEASDLQPLKCRVEGSIILQTDVGVAIANGKKALKYDVEAPAPSVSLPVACHSFGGISWQRNIMPSALLRSFSRSPLKSG